MTVTDAPAAIICYFMALCHRDPPRWSGQRLEKLPFPPRTPRTALPPSVAPADEDLVAMTKSWTIVGKDLIKEVTCKEPYEWTDPTGEEWEFAEQGEAPRPGCPPRPLVP